MAIPAPVKTILAICIAYLMISCEKQNLEPLPQEPGERYGSSNFFQGIFSIIPADISKYNLLGTTRSSSDTIPENQNGLEAELFCLDSALLWNDESHLLFAKQNKLYRQIPLKMSGGEIYCSISDNPNQSCKSNPVATVKSYCIIVESLIEGELDRYIVTMLPESSPIKFNENCTFLEKGNYSGLIIYSDTDGNFTKIEHYENGLILSGEMLTPEEIETSDSVTYFTIYANIPTQINVLPTKSDDDDDVAWDDELDGVVVGGTRPVPDNENPSAGNDEGGGTGGDTSIPIPGDEHGGGGNSGDSSEELKYTVSISENGEGRTSGSGVYTKNTSVMLVATSATGNTFGGWVENFEIKSMDDLYVFKIESNHAFTAYFYGEETECGKLADKYKNNPELNKGFQLLDSIRNSSNTIEHGVYKTDFATNSYTAGSPHSIKIPWNAGIYDYFIHSHPNNSLIPSIEDIYGMYLSYKEGVFTEESSLLIQTDFGCLSLEVEDISLLEEFFENEVLKEIGTSNKEALANFHKKFNKDILNNPTAGTISNYTYTKQAIRYYLQRGIKIAQAEKDCSGNNINWNYVSLADTTLIYTDCIQ
ncbi:MAG: hypothetical protein E7121_04570 [Bacteroidales bacterium]|nr:hypothetical protein [Bacteroidales bacterium]